MKNVIRLLCFFALIALLPVNAMATETTSSQDESATTISEEEEYTESSEDFSTDEEAEPYAKEEVEED